MGAYLLAFTICLVLFCVIAFLLTLGGIFFLYKSKLLSLNNFSFLVKTKIVSFSAAFAVVWILGVIVILFIK